MTTTTNADRIPVIWTPFGDQLAAVAPVARPLPGWTSVASPELGGVLAKLAASAGRAADQVQVRTFTMRDCDLSFWDSAVRKGTDGYSYGVMWDENAKFLKNVQFKEMPPAVAKAPPVDPAQLVVAAALHQVQQTLARMEEQLSSIQATVEWLEGRRQSRQAAELLTAVATLDSVGRRCLASGAVQPEDLLRIAHLEQVVGTVHREIAMELHAITDMLSFTDVKSAKVASSGPRTSRAADLIKLDTFALEGLMTYHRLLITSKVANGWLAPGEVAEAKSDLKKAAGVMIAAAKKLQAVDTHMQDRSIWDYMLTTGYFKGRHDDGKLREAANTKRSEVQAAATTASADLRDFTTSLRTMDLLALENRAPLALLGPVKMSA